MHKNVALNRPHKEHVLTIKNGNKAECCPVLRQLEMCA